VGEADWPIWRITPTDQCGPKRRETGRSSPAGEVSVGPGGFDRGTGAVRSSVRSHHIVRSQPSVPRCHHCRPPAHLAGVWQALRGQVGRPPSLGLAAQSARVVPCEEPARCAHAQLLFEAEAQQPACFGPCWTPGIACCPPNATGISARRRPSSGSDAGLIFRTDNIGLLR
jgi:hypothetical protein